MTKVFFSAKIKLKRGCSKNIFDLKVFTFDKKSQKVQGVLQKNNLDLWFSLYLR